jgi:Kef-type K+ transport system membrane component KefB
MEHADVSQFLGLLFVILGAAKVFGQLARKIGQPAVLGELVAGVLIGKHALGLVDPGSEVLHLLGELGVIILLFSIGLETDLGKLLSVGPASTAVAVVGVVLPFALGYAIGRLLGLDQLVAILAGSALTATSVGITARVLSDLGQLQSPESQVVLGAAIIDDVIGLVVLGVVSGLAGGKGVTVVGVLSTTAVAFGFLGATLLIGSRVIPLLVRHVTSRIDLPGTPTILALLLAFGLAWLADRLGSALIIGAFAAGLVLVKAPRYHDIEAGVTRLGHFFVPLFFVTVGAEVAVRVLNPLDPANHRTLLIAGLLVLAGIVGKFLAGYAPFWFRGNKALIGAAMVPRGEVGLIFAQMGRSVGVFDDGLFAAVTLVVLVTTFIAPPLLKALSPAAPPGFIPPEPEGIEDLATS